MDDSQVLPFTRKRTSGTEPPEPPDGTEGETIAPGDAYAVLAGQRRAISLDFRRANGDRFALSYSFRPLFWWLAQDSSLLIEYPSFFTVMLRGRHLSPLYGRLIEHRVTWVREGDAADSSAIASVITRIEIIRAFPSREGNDGLSDPS